MEITPSLRKIRSASARGPAASGWPWSSRRRPRLQGTRRPRMQRSPRAGLRSPAVQGFSGRPMIERDPLELEPETMRELGYRTVDALVDLMSEIEGRPVLRVAPREELEKLLGDTPPEAPEPFDRLLERLRDDVFPFVGLWQHPRFFAYIPLGQLGEPGDVDEGHCSFHSIAGERPKARLAVYPGHACAPAFAAGWTSSQGRWAGTSYGATKSNRSRPRAPGHGVDTSFVGLSAQRATGSGGSARARTG